MALLGWQALWDQTPEKAWGAACNTGWNLMHKKPCSSMSCFSRVTTLCLRSPAATYHCLSTVPSLDFVLCLDLPSAMEYREAAISDGHQKVTELSLLQINSCPICFPSICSHSSSWLPPVQEIDLLHTVGMERRKQNWCCTKLVSTLQALWTNLFCAGHKSLAMTKFLPTPEITVEVPSMIFIFLVPGQGSRDKWLHWENSNLK